jgi:hypothetical protein
VYRQGFLLHHTHTEPTSSIVFRGGDFGGYPGLGGGVRPGFPSTLDEVMAETMAREFAPGMGGMFGTNGVAGMGELGNSGAMGAGSNDLIQAIGDCDSMGMGDLRHGAQQVLMALDGNPHEAAMILQMRGVTDVINHIHRVRGLYMAILTGGGQGGFGISGGMGLGMEPGMMGDGMGMPGGMASLMSPRMGG